MKRATLYVGLSLIAIVVLLAAVGLVWTPFDPTAVTNNRLAKPGWPHLLGTDASGRAGVAQELPPTGSDRGGQTGDPARKPDRCDATGSAAVGKSTSGLIQAPLKIEQMHR